MLHWAIQTSEGRENLLVYAAADQVMKVHPATRDARSIWQLARRRTAQLWRQKHGRMLLLAPLLLFLFTVFWTSASVSCSLQPCDRQWCGDYNPVIALYCCFDAVMLLSSQQVRLAVCMWPCADQRLLCLMSCVLFFYMCASAAILLPYPKQHLAAALASASASRECSGCMSSTRPYGAMCLQDTGKQLSISSSPSGTTEDSAAHYSAARQAALKIVNQKQNSTSKGETPISSVLASRLSGTDALTNTSTGAQTDEEAEAEPPDLAKAMLDILDFPEDLDGPDNPALLGLVDTVSYNSSDELQGLIAPSSRLFRPGGKWVAYSCLVLSSPFVFLCFCSTPFSRTGQGTELVIQQRHTQCMLSGNTRRAPDRQRTVLVPLAAVDCAALFSLSHLFGSILHASSPCTVCGP